MMIIKTATDKRACFRLLFLHCKYAFNVYISIKYNHLTYSGKWGKMITETKKGGVGMTLREASKSFGIAEDVLRQYEKNGLLKSTSANGGADNYREEDFEQLGLIKFLLETGFSFKDLKRYLELMRNSKTTDEQIYMLRKRRSELLEGIHEKQQLLDRIDYMIWEKRKETAQ